jgi:hypothetical protein
MDTGFTAARRGAHFTTAHRLSAQAMPQASKAQAVPTRTLRRPGLMVRRTTSSATGVRFSFNRKAAKGKTENGREST